MSDAPRWPGADGSPGLDFSSNRNAASGGNIYRDGDGPGSASPASRGGVTSVNSPPRNGGGEAAAESTTISAPSRRTYS